MALSDKDFNRLRAFIDEQVGIKLGEVKRTMLEGRLHKRVRALGLQCHGDYCDFIFSVEGQRSELVHLIDAVTTNKTDFFREPAHFELLNDKLLPALERGFRSGKGLRVWSAGCSSGEEPYTLAMVLEEFIEAQGTAGLKYEILASDISTRMLEHARRAVYSEERIAPVPQALRKKYLLRSKDRRAAQVRIVPQLRTRLRFARINFMDEDFGLREPFDIIFCRNVIIYFDKDTQARLIRKFSRLLPVGGYLFLGHSESLFGVDAPFSQIAPTVYQRVAG